MKLTPEPDRGAWETRSHQVPATAGWRPMLTLRFGAGFLPAWHGSQWPIYLCLRYKHRYKRRLEVLQLATLAVKMDLSPLSWLR